jgi:hypothetical protein
MTNFSKNRTILVRTTVRIVFAIGTLAIGMGGLISCQSPSSTDGAGSAPASSSSLSSPSAGAAGGELRAANGPVRDLSQDEAAGGHILRKHVGQTDAQLRERLEHERRITGASTYTDRSAAEHAVGAAIAAARDRIERWLSRPGGHPNLVLDYDSPTPIGRTINRGESEARSCSHALVVLKYAGPNDYYVLTSYPECRS